MKIIILAIVALLLVGCGNTAPIQVSSKPVDRIALTLPAVDRIYSRDVKWIVITPENAEAVFEKLKKTGQPIAIIGVTGDGYEILALSNGDKQVLIRQLQAQIKAYKSYYIAVEERDEKHNDDVKKEKEVKKEKPKAKEPKVEVETDTE